MASILRTGKYLRHFIGFTRNIVHTVRNNHEASALLRTVPCIGIQYQRKCMATTTKQADVVLDRQLQQLDRDVRRIGRISRRNIEDILGEIRMQRSATTSQSLMVIRCCGNLVPEELPEVRTKLVQEIWKTLNAINVPMDISHYNALLRVYLENEYAFSPTEFLAELEAKSIEPNRVTYQRLIARYCQEGDIDGATKILEYMRSKNLPVNEAVFNSLIIGHSQANDLESAKGIISVMKQAGLEPSSETYATLMSCYAKHGDIEALMKTFNECEKQEILLIDKDLLDVIYQMTICGNGDKIDVLLDKFHRSFGFNQECVNTILRLTNLGYEDVCLKLLRIMPRGNRPNGQLTDCGSFFIRQLVKAKRPLDKILTMCKKLEEEGLNTKSLLIAAEASLSNGLIDLTLALLKEFKSHNLPVRQHYFWPLFCSGDKNEIVNIIHVMQNEYDMSPSTETLRDYVIPNLKESNWDKILTFLRDAGIPTGTAAAASSYAALMENQMDKAAEIMETFRSLYSFQTFRQPLVSNLEKQRNYEAFVRCLRQIHDSVQRKFDQVETEQQHQQQQSQLQTQKDEEEEIADDETVAMEKTSTPDIIGEIILDIHSYYRQNSIEILEKLLPQLVDEGFTISNINAERLSDKLASRMTPDISEALGRLSSGELVLKPLKNSARKKSLDNLTIEELERYISNVEAKGEDSSNLKRHLLNTLFRLKDLDRALKVMERLEADKNFIIGTGIQAQLIDLYVQHNRLTDALDVYNTVKKKEPTFQLDHVKTMGVVELMLKEDRFDEAIQFLEVNKREDNMLDIDASYNYTNKVWRTLNILADKGEAEKLQKMFDALVDGKYIIPTNVILGPLIKVHLVKDDIDKAIDTFEKMCELYKATPWKNELARRLIQAEDATNLQRITDLSTSIHGEINSLYDLVFSFVECGRVRQARRILETPGLRTRSQRINSACERYKNEGMIEPLEGLIEVTKDLSHIDRNNIYYTLLLSYCNAKEADKALGLWMKMQEESVTPSDQFLIKLAELLHEANRNVPFVVPNRITSNDDDLPEKSYEKTANIDGGGAVDRNSRRNTANYKKFRSALRMGDIDGAISIKEDMASSINLSASDISILIEQLVKANRLREATKYVNELLSKQSKPSSHIFRFYLNNLANAGDVETMSYIGEQLTDEQKRVVSFDNRFCHASIIAGKTGEYMKKLQSDAEKIQSEEDAAKLAEKFPRGGAIGILEKYPELVGQYQQLAEKYAKYQQLGPINVLWMHYMSNGDEVNSKAIWNKYLSNAPRLMFQRVLQTARETNNEQLVHRVLQHLRESKISEGAIGNAYSCLIDILISQRQFDKALDAIHTAVKDISLEHINRTALQRLKQAVEDEKKLFPFNIPQRKGKEESSSSQSDDDVGPKVPETRPSKPHDEKEVQRQSS